MSAVTPARHRGADLEAGHGGSESAINPKLLLPGTPVTIRLGGSSGTVDNGRVCCCLRTKAKDEVFLNGQPRSSHAYYFVLPASCVQRAWSKSGQRAGGDGRTPSLSWAQTIVRAVTTKKTVATVAAGAMKEVSVYYGDVKIGRLETRPPSNWWFPKNEFAPFCLIAARPGMDFADEGGDGRGDDDRDSSSQVLHRGPVLLDQLVAVYRPEVSNKGKVAEKGKAEDMDCIFLEGAAVPSSPDWDKLIRESLNSKSNTVNPESAKKLSPSQLYHAFRLPETPASEMSLFGAPVLTEVKGKPKTVGFLTATIMPRHINASKWKSRYEFKSESSLKREITSSQQPLFLAMAPAEASLEPFSIILFDVPADATWIEFG